MLIENQHPHNKSITVSVLGVPNAGKSTFVNALMGTELNIVTHKAQTTRNRISCVLQVDRTEVILIDTPGLHKSSKEINLRYNSQAKRSLEGADLNLLLIDLTQPIASQVDNILGVLKGELSRTWLVLTKSDAIKGVGEIPVSLVFDEIKKKVPTLEKFYVTSAKEDEGLSLLLADIVDESVESPHFFSKGSMSNKSMRFFVSEYIREQAFILLNEELPYELGVLIDDYKNEKKEEGKVESFVSASIIVNRPSQRGIVVGTKGSMIKEIGVRARKKIEDLAGHRVHLNLHVKVMPKWFKSNMILEQMGLPRAQESARVWRK